MSFAASDLWKLANSARSKIASKVNFSVSGDVTVCSVIYECDVTMSMLENIP